LILRLDFLTKTTMSLNLIHLICNSMLTMSRQKLVFKMEKKLKMRKRITT